MLTSHKIENDVITEINDMIGDDIDDISLTEETSLVSVSLSSLMLAKLIVNLSEEFDHSPFNKGDYAIVDVHTVGNLVSAYSQNRREVQIVPEALLKHASVAIRSIDGYLEPSSRRFFGGGYKQSTCHIQPHMDDDKLSASVDVSYPTDWSLKGKEPDLRPHLSTVDAMILGVRSTETPLRNVFSLTPNQVELTTIQKLVIRTGTRPEELLEGLQLSAEIKNTDTTTNSDGQTTDSTVVVQVGVMQATVTARHEAPRAERPDPSDYSYLIENSNGYWSAGYRYRDQLIENAIVDIETLSAETEVNVVSKLGDLSKTKGSYSQQFVTFIDVFISLLQLGQVPVYELDGISRGKSETLWMQRLVLRPSSDHEGCTSVVDRVMATLCITDHQLLTLPSRKWRSVDFTDDSGSIDFSATFVHRAA